MKGEAPPRVSRRQALRITAAAGLSLAMGGAIAAGLAVRARVRRVSATRVQMGTPVTVTIFHPEGTAARRMVDATFAEIERLESVLSRHRPETPVARLNREGIVRDSPTELIEVVGRAKEYSALTGGAFDITIAPLLDLYRSRLPGGLPLSEHEIERALRLVDHRQILIEDRVIALGQAGMAISLDGIGKGYVVDRAVAALVAAGAENVMVEAGGDIASAGNGAAGESWRVALQDPRNPRDFLGLLQLRGDAVATSGDYVQILAADRSLHHILDPRTGRSPDHTSAVTVIAPSAMDADALSTAVFVLGPVRGLDLLDSLDGREGVIVTKDQEKRLTKGIARFWT